ncbi:class I SAM-dependent methyltransferase [Terricaulis sp.]|uniref:class I SAM-dependent methyltransferase n=1 Tax=Terricaulis sp. TaxID=2768686 RepID=UPI003784BAC9
MPLRPVYSFVVDTDARFAYEAWHLAQSLLAFCAAQPGDIHAHFTPEVAAGVRAEFANAGFHTHTLTRFGDGRHCNKIAQIAALPANGYDVAVLLDTDTIAVGDLRLWLNTDAIVGKIVDGASTRLETLNAVAAEANLIRPIETLRTDNDEAATAAGYFNGGFYAIPRQHLKTIDEAWRRWATWLLHDAAALKAAGRMVNADQVSFWLALQSSGLPFKTAASNANYFTHMHAPHVHYDPAREIALLHHHHEFDVLGFLAPTGARDPAAQAAIARANAQIAQSFNNTLFWSFRYQQFPERGSGVGSRGENLERKRALLLAEGAEDAVSVLDVGCGDLEVVKALRFRRYAGVDVSPLAVERARALMPDAAFYLGLSEDVPAADMVLCFEVLIHQTNAADYQRVIDFVTQRTARTLLISGYDAPTEAIARNPMVFFHEPLSQSLARSGRFSSIRAIAAHTTVTVFRCDV